jgi:ankyrin repeat protein
MSGADPNAQGWGVFQEAPLHIAVLQGREDIAKLLLSNGANPNISGKGGRGRTPLCIAAEKGYNDIAKTLIANGARVDLKDSGAITPLGYAAMGNHLEPLT